MPQVEARLAGGLWVACIVTGMLAFVVESPLIVQNDAALTATNIMANESSFRLAFAADLMSGLTYVGVTALLYVLLKPIGTSVSSVAAFFGLGGVAIGGVAFLAHLAPVVLLRGDAYLNAFTTSQLQAMALLALKLRMQMFSIGMVWFGIQCMLIGYLIVRSKVVPRALGALLAAGGSTYLLVSFAHFLAPAVGDRLMLLLMPVALIGEGALAVWLLAKGVNGERQIASA